MSASLKDMLKNLVFPLDTLERNVYNHIRDAEVAELADALDSKSSGLDKFVRVQVPPSAPVAVLI